MHYKKCKIPRDKNNGGKLPFDIVILKSNLLFQFCKNDEYVNFDLLSDAGHNFKTF